MGVLSLLLGEPGQRFINLVYHFKEPTVGFIDLFLFFKIYMLFISSLIFIYPSFCWLWILFVLLFLILLDGELGCLFEIFLISWGRPWIAINIPLRNALAESHRFWKVVFLFSFVSRYFRISSLISSLTYWFFSSMLFSLLLRRGSASLRPMLFKGQLYIKFNCFSIY